MADMEQVALLKQGWQVWDAWRKDHANTVIDLSGADLTGADLSDTNLGGADLSDTNLTGAYLWNANLTGANLEGADLSGVNLSDTNLWNANLTGANLEGARLSGANLCFAYLMYANLGGADLSDANLGGANLWSAYLHNTDFQHTTVGGTQFTNLDLREARHLETVEHDGPSSIGTDTLVRSAGDIPEVFLRGAGLSDTFIEYVRALTQKPIEYYACFISYSHKDEAFAKQLYADLQSNGVRCWLDQKDLKWGARIRQDIDKASSVHDKLLLILSKHSLASGWVEHEVKEAMKRERKEKQTILFPIRLDKAILESPLPWAADIRHDRNVGDFTRWKEHDCYQQLLERLLHDLKAEKP